MPDIYLFSLALGGAGLAGMAVLGAYGSGPHGSHHGDGVGHGSQPVGSASHGPAHAGHPAAYGDHPVGPASDAHGHSHLAHGGPHWGVLLSPRVAFSALAGFGAVGLALQPVLAGPWLFAAALAGGIAFEALLIGPFWNFLLRFASHPALTLEHGVMDEAEAVTPFNPQGDGLVKLVVDGQVVQLLGTLASEERVAGVRVRAGDRLVIESVDAGRQRCTVSRRDRP